MRESEESCLVLDVAICRVPGVYVSVQGASWHDCSRAENLEMLRGVGGGGGGAEEIIIVCALLISNRHASSHCLLCCCSLRSKREIFFQ